MAKKMYNRNARQMVGRVGNKVGEGRFVIPVFNFAKRTNWKEEVDGTNFFIFHRRMYSEHKVKGEKWGHKDLRQDLMEAVRSIAEAKTVKQYELVVRVELDGWFDLFTWDRKKCIDQNKKSWAEPTLINEIEGCTGRLMFRDRDIYDNYDLPPWNDKDWGLPKD